MVYDAAYVFAGHLSDHGLDVLVDEGDVGGGEIGFYVDDDGHMVDLWLQGYKGIMGLDILGCGAISVLLMQHEVGMM